MIVTIVHPVPRLRSDKGRRRFFADVRLEDDSRASVTLNALEFTELGPETWHMRVPSIDGRLSCEMSNSMRGRILAAFADAIHRADRLAEEERAS